MVSLITLNQPDISENLIRQRTALGFLILDPSWFRLDIGCVGHILPNILTKVEADLLENYGRKFCYQLYKRRLDFLMEDDDDTETETEDDYTLKVKPIFF